MSKQQFPVEGRDGFYHRPLDSLRDDDWYPPLFVETATDLPPNGGPIKVEVLSPESDTEIADARAAVDQAFSDAEQAYQDAQGEKDED